MSDVFFNFALEIKQELKLDEEKRQKNSTFQNENYCEYLYTNLINTQIDIKIISSSFTYYQSK